MTVLLVLALLALIDICSKLGDHNKLMKELISTIKNERPDFNY